MVLCYERSYCLIFNLLRLQISFAPLMARVEEIEHLKHYIRSLSFIAYYLNCLLIIELVERRARFIFNIFLLFMLN